jgi:hypothetical protein
VGYAGVVTFNGTPGIPTRITARAPGNPTVRTRSGYYATPDANTNK